jgi:hypothetical protein
VAVALSVALPTVATAQVFLASAPHPDFAIGPLFVVANVRPDLGPVTVNLSWSLTPRRGARAADIQQDLYLLWPAEVAESTAPGPADSALVREVERRGFAVAGSGRLTLRSRDRMQLGTTELGEPLETTASWVNFARAGPASSQIGAVAYVKIPWTPTLADPLSVVTLALPLRGLIVRKATTWIDELFWGRRYVLTAGFGDLGPLVLPLFALYYERRDHVVRLAREFSMVIANFADADHLKIDEIAPATATRRQSRVRAGAEVVALVLAPSEDVSAQSVRVQFKYFGGRINWRPVVVSAALLLLGNFAGVLILSKDVSRRLRRRLRARRRFRTGAAAPNGTVPSRETLATLVPGSTTYAEVLGRCGAPDEERERLAPPGRRTLLYRERRDVEHHEVEIELEDGRVHEIHSRVRRGQATTGSPRARRS